MTLRHFIPPPFQHVTSLRCLHIELDDFTFARALRGRSAFDMKALGKFPQSCPLLAELKFRVVDAQFVNASSNPSPFSLPCVETVSIEVPFCNSNTAVPKGLLAEVRFPAASELELSFGLYPNINGGELLTHMTPIFANKSIFPSVIKLKLIAKCTEPRAIRRGDSGPINIPFSLLGGIRDLTLHLIGFDKVNLPAPNARLPPLRSLRLEQCDSIDFSWLLGVLRKLEMQGNLGELEDLSTKGCGSLLRDIDVKCRSIPQGTIFDFLNVRLTKTVKGTVRSNLQTGLYKSSSERMNQWIDSVYPEFDGLDPYFDDD